VQQAPKGPASVSAQNLVMQLLKHGIGQVVQVLRWVPRIPLQPSHHRIGTQFLQAANPHLSLIRLRYNPREKTWDICSAARFYWLQAVGCIEERQYRIDLRFPTNRSIGIVVGNLDCPARKSWVFQAKNVWDYTQAYFAVFC